MKFMILKALPGEWILHLCSGKQDCDFVYS